MSKPNLLIVDDEKPTRDGLRAGLEEKFEVYVAEDAQSAFKLLGEETFDALLTDLRMAGEDGLKLITRAKALPKPPVCILMTAYGSEEVAVEAMKHGADDYVSKGRLNFDELELRIRRALGRRELETENVDLRRRLDSKFAIGNLIGEAPAMKEVVDTLLQVAPARTTVLVTGESGTGKELVAKAIHQNSPRSRGPMVTVNCAALPSTLLEAELFGHERGAFTGAHERRAGRIEQAEGGTLFLDEIGEIDAATQVKLLRFLGERTFERLGSGRTMTADVRLIAATNKDLATLVRAAKFREDLFYRLAVVQIHLPPLRDRIGDLPALAHAFLKEFAADNAKAVTSISTEAMDALLHYQWPGNIRELRAALEHAVVMTRGGQIGIKDLPSSVRNFTPSIAAIQTLPTSSPEAGRFTTIKEAEKQLLVHALQEASGNRTLAAAKLGISRRTLHRRLHEFHLEGF
jgi:two-component system, NtrC family, response regulator AtoC